MKYNAEYNRWVTTGGLIYRYSEKDDKLILCKQSDNGKGYLRITTPNGTVKSHRLVWETFNGKIPSGMEIDHIDSNKQNNCIDNLRCVTHYENMNNILTKQRVSKGRTGLKLSEETKHKISERLKKPRSKFGLKFFEHFGMTRADNADFYNKEYAWYASHNKKCRWE